MLWQIFITFFKIGAFTLGGGYAMLPLIKKEVCSKRGWISEDDFVNGIAAAQSAPGPIAVNISIYTGYHVAGFGGMFMAVLGAILPSLITIILIAMLFQQYAEQVYVKRAFSALRPAVVALIATPLIEMAKKSGLKTQNAWFPLLAAILVGYLNITPIYLIVITIVFAIWESYK
ncbi:MAG: chromate transporter [Candidatus Cloacimonetes bacterium]|nr:chromate transporter [Candidatus Cloacimonadota bacterium]